MTYNVLEWDVKPLHYYCYSWFWQGVKKC